MDKPIALKSTNKLVPALYYEMFVLRIQGYDMKEIAQQTGYSHSHVKHVFMKGGVLNDLYRDWVENRKGDKVEEAMDLMFEHLPDVVRANIGHAMTTGIGAPAARKLIFDGTLGDLMKRADAKPVGSNFSTVADLIEASYEEIKNETDQGTISENEDEVAGRSADLPQG